MTADEVRARVEAELERRESLVGAHGISAENVDEYRVGPTRCELFDASTKQMLPFWIVVDEAASSEMSGYLVVFDESCGRFGLAMKGRAGSPATFVGYTGNLIDTLNGI